MSNMERELITIEGLYIRKARSEGIPLEMAKFLYTPTIVETNDGVVIVLERDKGK